KKGFPRKRHYPEEMAMGRFCPDRRGSAACFAVLMGCSGVWAQATTSLRGAVSDPSGAVVTAANIVLVNLGSGVMRTAVTDDNGAYQFLQVTSGTYRLRAEYPGFRSVVRESLQLLVNTPTTVDLRFAQVGNSIDVDVFATPLPAVNTVDATIGNTIQNSQ